MTQRIQLFDEARLAHLPGSVDLPSSETEFQIPEEILALSTDFKYEIIARTASGNNTAVEACFTLE